MREDTEIEIFRFSDDGVVPNNTLPVVLYRGAVAGENGPQIARRFAANRWPGAWTNGIYDQHHYHATAHEVLGIARGRARVRLGGEGGRAVELAAGDVVVIPAGVAHKRESASPDLVVIGAYPESQQPDMHGAAAADRKSSLGAVAAVALPAADPVTGGAQPLLEFWKSR